MYVCICNGHRDRDLEELAARGVSCVHEAYKRLGGEPVCGRCLDFAQDLIDGARPVSCPNGGAVHLEAFVPAEPAR